MIIFCARTTFDHLPGQHIDHKTDSDKKFATIQEVALGANPKQEPLLDQLQNPTKNIICELNCAGGNQETYNKGHRRNTFDAKRVEAARI